MSEMRFSGLTFAIIIALGMMIGMGSFIGEIGNSYNREANTTFVDNSKQMSRNLNQSTQDIQQTYEKIASDDVSFLEGVYGGFQIVLSATGAMFSMTAGIFTDMPRMMMEMSGIGGITPIWFIGLLITALTFVVLFTWLNWGRGSGKI